MENKSLLEIHDVLMRESSDEYGNTLIPAESVPACVDEYGTLIDLIPGDVFRLNGVKYKVVPSDYWDKKPDKKSKPKTKFSFTAFGRKKVNIHG